MITSVGVKADTTGAHHRTVRAPTWLPVAAAIVGSVAIGIGLAHDPARTWSNLLVDGFCVLLVALGGMVFIAVHHLSGAAWSAGIRRVAEAMMCALPIAALMMLALFFGRDSLYAWAAGTPVHEQEIVSAISWYFTVPFIFTRMAFFLTIWMLFAALMRRTSAREDTSAEPIHHQRMVRYSAAFIVVLALSFSLATVDWLLSLDPRWTSTIFAVYVGSGLLVEGVAAITLAVVVLHERGHLADVVNENHLHDLGKLLFAFTTFWAYLWFSQYLLIWYGNLPEETSHYAIRTDPSWVTVFLANLIVNWLIPFVVLLPRASKRRPSVLKWVAVVILLGRWLDVYLLVAPQTMKAPAFGLFELSIAFAYGALTWYVVAGALARRPLVVQHDPYLYDCLRHQQ